MKFRKGHLVKLKEDVFIRTKKTHQPHKAVDVNIFEITKIGNTKVKLSGIDKELSINEIEPIPVNGVDDRWIYFEPCVAATRTEYSQIQEPIYTDYTYYLSAIKNINNSGMNTSKFKYVHEVQNHIKDDFPSGDMLCVNLFKS